MKSAPPFTIAFVLATPGTTWGGMERHTADLSEALSQRGHAVHVFGHCGYRDRFSPDVHFHDLPVQLGRRNPWLTLTLRRQLRRICADIVHAQGNKAAQLVGTIRRLSGVSVGTVHGTKSSHKAFRRLDQVIAVSPQVYNNLQHPKKHLIYNGVDVSRPPAIGARSADLPRGVINLIAVGRLEPVKGFDQLIRAWASLGADKSGAHLTIIGDGSQRSILNRQIGDLGLEHSVTLAGFCSDLAPAYRAATATIISSKREGFPYVLIEALLHGCPVLSTPVAGAKDLLPNQWLSQGHDSEAIRDLLRLGLSDTFDLREAQANVVAFAEQALTLDSMVNKTEALYLEALGRAPGPI